MFSSCSYEAGSDLLTDLDCQKRAICEVYRYPQELGEVSKRAKHSLNLIDEAAKYLSLTDELLNLVDEYAVR